MNFPTDSEIREFAAYSIRARKIIIEEFKQNEGRIPNELEIQDLLKMVVVPFGILKQQNGNSHSSNQSQQQKPQEQPKNTNGLVQGKPVDSKIGWKSEVLRLLNEFPQLERKSQYKIKIIKEIPRSDWNSVKEGFEKEGWKYDWKEKAFVMSEEMKA